MSLLEQLNTEILEISNWVEKTDQEITAHFKGAKEKISEYYVRASSQIESTQKFTINQMMLAQMEYYQQIYKNLSEKKTAHKQCKNSTTYKQNATDPTLEQNSLQCLQRLAALASNLDESSNNLKSHQANLHKLYCLEHIFLWNLEQLNEKIPSEPHHLTHSRTMHQLIADLSQAATTYKNTLNNPNTTNEKNTQAENIFRKNITNYMASSELKNLKKQNSIFYPIYYAFMSVLRAILRVFDITITFAMQAKQTMENTPNRIPFFKLPEQSMNVYIDELEEKVNSFIQLLDDEENTHEEARVSAR